MKTFKSVLGFGCLYVYFCCLFYLVLSSPSPMEFDGMSFAFFLMMLIGGLLSVNPLIFIISIVPIAVLASPLGLFYGLQRLGYITFHKEIFLLATLCAFMGHPSLWVLLGGSSAYQPPHVNQEIIDRLLEHKQIEPHHITFSSITNYNSGTWLIASLKPSESGQAQIIQWDGFTDCAIPITYQGEICPHTIHTFKAVPFVAHQYWLYREYPSVSQIIQVDSNGTFHYWPISLALLPYLSSWLPLVIFGYLKKRNYPTTAIIILYSLIWCVLFRPWEFGMGIPEALLK